MRHPCSFYSASQVPALLDSSSLLNASKYVADDGPSTSVPAAHVEDLNSANSWLLLGLVLRLNQQMEDNSVSAF